MARNRYFEDEALTYEFSASSIKKALRYALPHRKTLITIIVLMLIFSFLALVPPVINRYIIDYVIRTKDGVWGFAAVQTLIMLLTAMGCIFAADIIFASFRTLFMAKVGHSIVHDIRRDAFVHLQKLGFDYYDSRPAGKILVRLTNYIDELAGVFSSVIVNLIVEGSKVILILVWLFVLEWRLALVVMIAVIPMSFLIAVLRKHLTRRFRLTRNKVSNRTAYIAESIQGAPITKAFNRAKLNTEIYGELCDKSNRAFIHAIRLNELFFPTLDGFFYLGLMMVYGAALFFSASAAGLSLTLGGIIAFISYMGMFSAPLNSITATLQQLTSATSNLERVFEVVETPPSVFDKPDAYPLPPIDGHIVYQNVTFAYEKGTPVLQDFNLDIPAGKMIALVGPTGGGKTTVVNLITRFYDPQAGRVLIDGHDVSGVSLFSLRGQIGVMMQDSFIFAGTILDNIRYARPDATEAECIAAAKSVFADAFIERLPNGYRTVTAEGGQGLSSGEKQLLSLARVVLVNPKILILDEATSSVDTATEELVKNALDVILKGRTSFVIAHRLSTIKKADCILFIKDKGIAEAGTHEALMAKKGLYYNLVTNE
ncbi:MAG: ABC transporter ATP-binding protein/permease [Clostridiales bacterium]|jgi:ATP-binding cassette subfamily B protein|nr:ABC transporter ATP-binding protein/permease [Clostridiales bacterium]